MGQKVHPRGLRLGIIYSWDSKWFADKDYQNFLHEDFLVRDTILTWNFRPGEGEGKRQKISPKLNKKIKRDNRRFSAISRVEIERKAPRNITAYIATAKPGVVIGRSGDAIQQLERRLCKITDKDVKVKLRPIENQLLDAYLVADSVAAMIERRFTVRRAIRTTVEKTMRAGALGVRIGVAGRLGGAEIARKEWVRKGRVPLHTLRANIDYAVAEAHTTYGIIGVKVWIYLGEIKPEQARRIALGLESAYA